MIPVRSDVVSAVILQADRKLPKTLLLKRAKAHIHGEWVYVAGRIEQGEKAHEAIRREIREETGLRAQRLYTADFCEQFYDASNECVSIVPAFVAYVDPGAPIVINEEHSAARWVTLRQARELAPFGLQRQLFEHVRQEFVLRKPSRWLEIVD